MDTAHERTKLRVHRHTGMYTDTATQTTPTNRHEWCVSERRLRSIKWSSVCLSVCVANTSVAWTRFANTRQRNEELPLMALEDGWKGHGRAHNRRRVLGQKPVEGPGGEGPGYCYWEQVLFHCTQRSWSPSCKGSVREQRYGYTGPNTEDLKNRLPQKF